jgi:hypothetical protein
VIGCAVFGGALVACAEVARMPEVNVTGSALLEETAVGPYGQPDWTTERRFPTTRVYLQQPPWGMGVEQWVRSKFYDGERGVHRVQQEFEIGLPHRFQIDLYNNSEINSHGTMYHDNVAGEVRYALADWGKIPLNPTLYAEYKLKDEGANVAEYKLLLGDDLGHGWHWGFNFAYEYDIGGEERAKEYAEALAISKTIVDRKFSLGIEAQYASESVEGSRDNPENSLNIGPSLQWRPVPEMHVDLSVMPGFTDDAPDILSFIVIGYDFGAENYRGVVPASLKSK